MKTRLLRLVEAVASRRLRQAGLLAGLALAFLPWLVPPAGAQGPTLGVTNDSSGTSVLWPVADSGFALWWTTDVGDLPITWQPYTNPPSLSGDESSLLVNLTSLQSTNPQAFFQLISNIVVVPGPPDVVTYPPAVTNHTGATLSGTVDPKGLDTTYWFEWGTSANPYDNTNYPYPNVVDGSNTAPTYVYDYGLGGALSPGTTYYCQLFGSNVDGISSGGNVTFSTPTYPPDAQVQTLGASNVTSSSALLQGTVNGEYTTFVGHFEWGTTTSYGSNADNFGDSFANAVTYYESTVLSNLLPSTTYVYRITAYNGGQDEALGQPVYFTTSAAFQQPPPMVQDTLAVSNFTTQETFSGHVNPEGADTHSYYLWGTNSSFVGGGSTLNADPHDLGAGGSVVASPADSIGDLLPNTLYYVACAAYNSGGTTIGTPVTFTTGAHAPGPPSVTGEGAINQGQTSAGLIWQVNPEGGSSTACVPYFGSNPSNLVSQGVFSVPFTDFAYHPFTNPVTGLMPGTTYYFYVLAGNNYGNTNGALIAFTTPTIPCPGVQTLSAFQITSNSAGLSGLISPGGVDADEFFQWGTNASYGQLVGPIDAGSGQGWQTAVNVLYNLTPNTRYEYRLGAYNSGGCTNYGSNVVFYTLRPAPAAAGHWTRLANAAPGAVSGLLLLSDGSVMASASTFVPSSAWYRLTPSVTGGYTNGTWTTMPAMHDTRRAFSSQVLTNGQVFVAGGEYGTGSATAEIYDPLAAPANAWRYTSPPYVYFYDAESELLPDGRVLEAPGTYYVPPADPETLYIYNPVTDVWSGAGNSYCYQSEASWVKLPDNSILTIDIFDANIPGSGTNSERYIPSPGSASWVHDRDLPFSMISGDDEIGPAFLLPDGRAFFLGGTGHTAFYTPSGTTNAGAWAQGPDIPNGMVAQDDPGAMMFNGRILFDVSTAPTAPTYFCEFDPVANAFNTNVPAPGGGLSDNVDAQNTMMLDLPDGTVLYSHDGSDLYVYQPSGSPLSSGKPAISNLSVNGDGSATLTGTGFNGISEGADYGDDFQPHSNYPIVQLTSVSSGAVYYGRTFNWSSTGVMLTGVPVSTQFTLPAGAVSNPGNYHLRVIANGIPSDPITITVPLP